MTESEVLKIFENEVIILDCWIEHCKDIIADCETEDDEFDDDKERAELSLKDYTERKEAFDVAISALKEIQQYREIGTVEECREAAEKQTPKKCIKDSCPDHTHYKCPSCGKIQKTKYDDSTFGCILNNCSNCGQAIRWVNENLEGMEDE